MIRKGLHILGSDFHNYHVVDIKGVHIITWFVVCKDASQFCNIYLYIMLYELYMRYLLTLIYVIPGIPGNCK